VTAEPGRIKRSTGEPTVVSLLLMRAEQQPDRLAYTFVSDEGEESLTYSGLDQRARAIARRLHALGACGKPVLLLYPPGIDNIAAFFGCLYAGAIAVPGCPPDPLRLERSQARIAAMTRDAMPFAVLTTAAIGAALPSLFRSSPELSRMRVVTIPDVCLESSGMEDLFPADPAAVALLQYTSGSVSAPKGVVLTHRNLMSNSEHICRSFGHSQESQAMIWLPPYHDMGLIGGIIQPLYAGFPVTLMAPDDFLRRPLRWLEEISRVRATTSGGPDFAFDLCVRKTTEAERARLDLSSWRVAFNGSEPVRVDTMERFAQAFEVAGFRGDAFRPCYGLAEATLMVTGGASWSRGGTRSFRAAPPGHGSAVVGPSEGRSRQLASCGVVSPDHRVVIVDPETLAECAAGQVGEIWISGGSVARSYWRRPRETQEIFGARLAGSGEGPFMRSGDLGFILGDQLFVTGRIKDLIIVRGCNYYPQDIEVAAWHGSRLLRRGCAAAFTVADGDHERLVVAHEVTRLSASVNVGELAGAIRAAVAAELGIQVHTVVLVRPGEIPKTLSGKVQRRLCAAMFEAGQLAELGRSATGGVNASGQHRPDRSVLQSAPAQERQRVLRDYLCSVVAAACGAGAGSITADAPLSTLGIDSFGIIGIQHSIEADLGAHLTASDLAHAVSLADLAVRLDEVIRAGGTARRIEVPGAHGQHAIWFLYETEPGTAQHGIAVALRFQGELEIPALENALAALVAGQPLLRRAFPLTDPELVKQIAGRAHTLLRENDVGDLDDARLTKWLEYSAREPFNLARGPLLRVHLYRRVTEEAVALVVAHHSIADVWSMVILARELEMLYAAQTGRVSEALPELTATDNDFVRLHSWAHGSRASVHAVLSPESLVRPHTRGASVQRPAAVKPFPYPR